jgi:hypothetical protein
MTSPLPLPISLSSFDQIVKGNVTIKKISRNYKYKITFRKIGKFLQYQVWDKNNTNSRNDKRIVRYNSATQWIYSFIEQNKILKPLFTPTTIMEIDNDKKFIFVIQKAYFNSRGYVIFIVSTREIQLQNNSSKKLTQLPIGKCNNVRFDIDSGSVTLVWVKNMTTGAIIATGAIIVLEVESSDTIDAVKDKIKDKWSISPNNQQLFFEDNELDEGGRDLASYNIKNNSILELQINI